MTLFSKAVEENQRPLIGVAALFALFAFAIWYAYSNMPKEDDGLKYGDVFSREEELQQKYETLKQLQESTGEEGQAAESMSREEKLKVLESLRE